ncbi:MAG: 3-deoxy-7-phosphoheptulonate synthase [Deltaproteobacteria bacterium]|nr:3-deoxy-7-phosphoheptulonate synthase [Deltaproteobacteria bacterium]
MLIVMRKDATGAQVDGVLEVVSKLGFKGHAMPGAQRVAIGITGNKGPISADHFRYLDGVTDAIPVSKPFKLVSREVKQEDTVIQVGGVTIGGGTFAVMAGPCAVESREQLLEVARAVKEAGASILRGGAYKPRTSPYSFQGLRDKGLEYLAEARAETGLPVVTEVKDVETLPMVAAYADILQIGARNMQNFSLLEAVGQVPKPVLLKRGLSSTVEEWLMAAEYLASGGNYQIILCERGIRTFETVTRNTLDLGILPVLRELTHLPVIVDPSHATGRWAAVTPLARASVAVGADGLMVEVHPDPARALSDGPQSLKPSKFKTLMQGVRSVAGAVGMRLA